MEVEDVSGRRPLTHQRLTPWRTPWLRAGVP
eukprot:COSAG06_NODE_24010_length_675_cov_0.869792_1_plen_30_part_01